MWRTAIRPPCSVGLKAFGDTPVETRDVARWRRNPPPGFLRPCELVLVDRPPAGPGWLHEVKHDGFRVVGKLVIARGSGADAAVSYGFECCYYRFQWEGLWPSPRRSPCQ
jgi:hypothetical protein